MIAATLYRPILLALGLAACIGAASAETLSVIPNPAKADTRFTLHLQGVAGLDCNSFFSRESATVTGNRIDLRYTVSHSGIVLDTTGGGDPAVCPVRAVPEAKSLPILPVFAMPALKAGSYEVWAANMPECLYSNPMCLIAVQPVSAGILKVEAAPAPAFFINPTSALPNQAFALQLLSYDFNCGTLYDSLSAVVADGVINLSFRDRQNPAALCAAVVMPYGPTFRIPALKEGSYKVKANRLSTNAVADAGILSITAMARKGWYLKEKKTLAEKSFAMQLLRDDIGNCQTSFADQTVTVSSKAIAVSFTMEQHPDRVCVQNIQPFGPVFEMPALKTGAYPVTAAVCEGLAGACKGPTTSSVADTLVVTQTLRVGISDLRARGPKVELRGQAAVFALPEGKTGSWRAELMTLDGRVLGRTMVSGPAGMRVSVPVGRAPANAVSLLRLTSPEGGERFLPIVR
jgi:hypothetical protein